MGRPRWQDAAALSVGRPAGRRGRRDAGHPQPTRRADDHHRGAAVRIVIAEDSVLLREGLTKLLGDGGFEVAAAVSDAEQLLRAVGEHHPDLVVVDVRMPPTHTDEGIRAALVIRRQYPEVAVVVLSQYVEERYATDLLSVRTSGVGYLLKDRVAHVSDFLDALRRVAAGGTALDPEVVAQLLVRRRSDPIDRLTPREQQVLRLMADLAGRSVGGELVDEGLGLGGHDHAARAGTRVGGEDGLDRGAMALVGDGAGVHVAHRAQVPGDAARREVPAGAGVGDGESAGRDGERPWPHAGGLARGAELDGPAGEAVTGDE